MEDMERVYTINGLDCANCAAKLERHLKEIQYFDQVVIDFMAQKLIITVKDEETLQKGLQIFSVFLTAACAICPCQSSS